MKESILVSSCLSWLGTLENLGKLIYIRNNSGGMQKGRSFVRFGKPGSPDIIIYLDKGKTIFIECKSDTGTQNYNQIRFEQRAIRLGYEYHIVREMRQLEDILKNNGVIK
jgi:hypothetical protein